MKKSFRLSIKKGLSVLGVEGYVVALYRRIYDRWFQRKYGTITRFYLNAHGVEVILSTEDYRSKHWLFPRYDGGKVHEEPVTRLMIKQLQTASCFVDVGCHIGYFTCIAAKVMNQKLVYAFEMDDINFTLLQKNLMLNGIRNVHAHNVAVSDLTGPVSYMKTKGRTGAGISLSKDISGEKNAETLHAKGITLDDFFCEREHVPDVVKIDVQGAEMKVLRGMSRIISENEPQLFIEVHPESLLDFQSSADEVMRTLIGHGYNLYEICSMRKMDEAVRLKNIDSKSRLTHETMIFAEK